MMCDFKSNEALYCLLQIKEEDFLRIWGKSNDIVHAEVQNGRYPPSIYYEVLYCLYTV